MTEPAIKRAKRTEGPTHRIGAIEVGMSLIDVLAASDAPMQLKEIAVASGMAPAKAHRYLASFIAAGMVSQAGKSGRYDLGPMALRVGVAALKRFDVIERACAGLAGLRDEIRATCFVAAWSDRGPIILRWEDSLRPVTVIVQVGSTMPLLTSATGRAFLAFLPPARTAKLVDTELAANAVDIDASPSLTEHIIRGTRAAGLGRTQGDFQVGIEALAAPIFEPLGEMVGAVTALGRGGEFDAALDGAVAQTLRNYAKNLAS